ncbi:diacylglycerol/lipid kinase family protein [Elizabethkingia anophelis]|uniref:diacylglycerol/lipid kinase family protein n=1 Tax=Elizabethkingia anophelis TaxID=1117645 RepID=UPI00200BD7D3|nr:YegS/Rv2252/BmrU family lipid kinase [Elizabethkingia anophelis]MCL1034217.1 YegS/Rv2252/BmrU family lipid kinase [Elizabethkingia anophelis]MCW2461988.1 YegS/Rv2252/BmrU family lipid kinase [Elizabethkingia anophelis]MCW2465672.1 YegS/Rv2252/BmrU family lipid kinase [Elizabethkingia anophelis]MCW2469357.1 YegS/Rv2252/BmrU family lipid kinase [Elizabethkingia anophelis]HBI9690408.1 YegS/Rv2252/BmrU family lipid kinase [Elizabethkingia anophelis]
MDAVFIINPFSAKKNYKDFLEKLQQKYPEANFMISKSIEDTHRFIDENFASTEVFVAVGGDGTISTVAQKLINTDKILAVFPAGSGNGFSNETNFTKNIDALLEKIKLKKFHKIDTFTVNGNLSINVSGTGFDGEVIKKFEKTSRGFTNYIKVTVKTFFIFKSIKVEFEEKYKQYNGDYLMLNVANTRQFGNNAYIAPHADYSDGLVDIVLVKKFPLWHSLAFAFRMFTKNLKENEYLTYFPVSELKFNVKNSKAWHLDGEGIEIGSPVEIKVLPHSLNILVD